MQRVTKSAFLLSIVALSGSAWGATFVSGDVSATADGTLTSATVASIPYSTPAVAINGNDTSTTTPFFSGLVYKTSFAQTVGIESGSTSGKSDITFTANAGDTYSLFGSTTGDAELVVKLFDQTTSSNIYSFDATTGLADGTGGPTLGTLQAGTYVFTIMDSLSPSSDSTSTVGSGGITLVSTGVAPEPSTAGIWLIGIGAMLLTARRRAKTVTA